jgi:putative hydrolase of the HAD superfamily
VLALGGVGIHVPFHTTWAHEHVETEVMHENFYQVESLKEIPKLITTR